MVNVPREAKEAIGDFASDMGAVPPFEPRWYHAFFPLMVLLLNPYIVVGPLLQLFLAWLADSFMRLYGGWFG